MEQVIAFALGVFIVTLVVGFVSMFRASKTVKANKESIDDLRTELEQLRQWAMQMNEDTHRAINDGERQIHSEFDKLYSTIDSRVDKLEARFRWELDELARELDTHINVQRCEHINVQYQEK